jgi:penicillin-binding protein 1C
VTLRLTAAAVVALAAVAATAALPLARERPPAFASVHDSYCPSDARLLDRHGAGLQEQRVDATRRRLAWTPLGAVSPALVDALLRSEDHRFLDHGGVDWRAVLAAAWQRARGGALRGASTVSMQVASLLDADLAIGRHVMRMEANQPVHGWIVTARRAGFPKIEQNPIRLLVDSEAKHEERDA